MSETTGSEGLTKKGVAAKSGPVSEAEENKGKKLTAESESKNKELLSRTVEYKQVFTSYRLHSFGYIFAGLIVVVTVLGILLLTVQVLQKRGK